MSPFLSPLYRPGALLAVLSAAGLGACSGLATRTEEPTFVAPGPNSSEPTDYPGLHHVVCYAPGYYSGSAPAGREGLQTLASLGVRTVISVDGAAPETEVAGELGLRYVHLPFSYDDVPAERRAELAQALHSCPGPIYVHCHHGKHRSAAGLAAGLVTAGRLDATAAEARMHVSGTSADYPGLWRSVRESRPLEADALRVDPESFPAVARVSGMVATMAEIDVVFDNIKAASRAGWRTPDDNPDLVPAHETRRLHALFDQLATDPESRRLPTDYHDRLREMISLCGDLDAAVRDGDVERASKRFRSVRGACKACHAEHRNR